MVERRPADHVEFVHVVNTVFVAARIEQRAYGIEVPVGGGPLQRVSVISLLACIRIRAVLEQQLHRVGMSGRGCGVKSGPHIVSLMRAEHANETVVIREQTAQHVDIAFGAGLEEARHILRLPLLHLGLERPPAREAMFARHGQQSGGKLRPRVSPPQLLQSIFGELFQVFERGTLGEF